MVKDELVQRSPIRIFMKSIHGGLMPGNMGIIASPTGIGKTSVLVQIALDKLLQGQKVIHVSFSKHTDYVLAWYQDIFNEFIAKKNLENEDEVKDDIVKNRVLMKFNQEGHTVDQILKSLRVMIKEGCFAADQIIIDGYYFTPNEKENISRIRDFAKELNLSIWYSCNVADESSYDKKKIPLVLNDYAELFDVIVVLDPKPDHIEFAVSKGSTVSPGQLALKLDPKTLLILE